MNRRLRRWGLVAGFCLSTTLASLAQVPGPPLTPVASASAPAGRSTLGQSRLPVGIPSSGSMANNGAVTLTTALDQTYPNIYLYMPAGAIAAASTAGYYSATCSGASACTLFNNLYVSGSAAIPASPVAFATTGPGAYTQTVGSSFNAYVLAVPGNKLGLYDEVQTHGQYSYPNSAGAKTLALNYGSFAFGSAAPTTTVTYGFQGGFANAGVATRQVQTGNNGMTTGTAAAAPVVGAVNSAAAANLFITLRLATATDYIILQSVVFEQISAASN